MLPWVSNLSRPEATPAYGHGLYDCSLYASTASFIPYSFAVAFTIIGLRFLLTVEYHNPSHYCSDTVLFGISFDIISPFTHIPFIFIYLFILRTY